MLLHDNGSTSEARAAHLPVSDGLYTPTTKVWTKKSIPFLRLLGFDREVIAVNLSQEDRSAAALRKMECEKKPGEYGQGLVGREAVVIGTHGEMAAAAVLRRSVNFGQTRDDGGRDLYPDALGGRKVNVKTSLWASLRKYRDAYVTAEDCGHLLKPDADLYLFAWEDGLEVYLVGAVLRGLLMTKTPAPAHRGPQLNRYVQLSEFIPFVDLFEKYGSA